MPIERPHRAFELSLSIGADTWPTLLHRLRELTDHIESHGQQCSSVGGGPSDGHVVTIRVDESMTHDRYFELLSDYLEQEKATCNR